jgi:hypothetical protein
MTDLNSLVPPNSPLYLLHGYGINSAGEIVGFGATSAGEIHGFLAIPTHLNPDPVSLNVQNGQVGGRKFTLSENARRQLKQLVRFRPFASETMQ